MRQVVAIVATHDRLPPTTTAEANDENSVYFPPENPRFEVVGIEGVDEEFFDRAYQEEVDVDEEFGGF